VASKDLCRRSERLSWLQRCRCDGEGGAGSGLGRFLLGVNTILMGLGTVLLKYDVKYTKMVSKHRSLSWG